MNTVNFVNDRVEGELSAVACFQVDFHLTRTRANAVMVKLKVMDICVLVVALPVAAAFHQVQVGPVRLTMESDEKSVPTRIGEITIRIPKLPT